MEENVRYILVDTKSSKVKKIKYSYPRVIGFFLGVVLLIAVSLKLSFNLILQFSHNSEIERLQNNNRQLENQLLEMNTQITGLTEKMDGIVLRDDDLRKKYDLRVIDEDVRKVGIGGSDLSALTKLSLGNPELENMIFKNRSIIDRMQRELKLETESYQSLTRIIDRKEDSLKYLPSIKPVVDAHLTDRFGMRRHPIYHRMLMHKGIDLGAKRGTPILATADGTVKYTGRNGGYGNFIVLNHKYGFVTKYGHLRKSYVRNGQRVKRGDKIGEVGSSGLSTAPHLHYEIIYRGRPINPLDYYFPDQQYN